MYNIDEALKTIYRNDMFPLTDSIAPKELALSFPGLNLTIGTDQFAVDKGDFELTESICKDDQLQFGKCNVSSVKFTLADVTDDIKGKEFNITQTVIDKENNYTLPLGYFSVNSATKQDDLRFKDIIAYDRMQKIDTDVSTWYNALFPTGKETYTLAAFRSSFLTYIGLEEDTSILPLPNDNMTVSKTVSTSALKGRTVIECCEAVNGSFGHMNRNGKFTHVVLGIAYTDYPQEDYPCEDYPTDEPYEQMERPNSVKFEEYTVKAIDKLIIKQDEDDAGITYGTGTNAYTIQGNFLLFGKSSTELQTIAANAAKNIFNREYRPYTADVIGKPYVEVGDMVKYHTDDTVVGYVFSRTLTGIQALRDTFTAEGTETVVQNVSLSEQIQQTKSKVLRVVQTVDEVSNTMSDLAEATESQFKQTNNEIALKVSKDGIISAINLTSEEAKIKANKITFEGLVTANEYFKILADGSIEAIKGKFSGELNAATFTGGSININNKFTVDENGVLTAVGGNFRGDITGGTININNKFKVDENGVLTAIDGNFSGKIDGAVITGCNITSEVANLGKLNIEGAYIMGWNNLGINKLNIDYDGNIICGSVQCGTVNGSYPINAGNIKNQSVSYADTAGSAPLPYAWQYALVTNMNYIAYYGRLSLPVPWPVN